MTQPLSRSREYWRTVHLFVWLMLWSLPAIATAEPHVTLAMRGGLVWLSATDATPRQILAEWTRVGGTRIMNGDRLGNAPMFIQLDGVAETAALDIVLQSAGGFVATRRKPESSVTSQFDAIWIFSGASRLASSANTLPSANSRSLSPAPPPAPVQPVEIAPGVFRLVGSDGQLVPDDQDDAQPQPRQ
jgi:hypothetical protein